MGLAIMDDVLFWDGEIHCKCTEEGRFMGGGRGRQLFRSDCSSHQVLKHQRSTCSILKGPVQWLKDFYLSG